ncbi:MAG: hypothetical protein LPJ87_01945 [Zoogloeaceae bacterium]|nr:hypothetical protein [Zoogloeaceae bacterium]
MTTANGSAEFNAIIDSLLDAPNELAVQRVKKLAERGNGHAHALLGVIYETGLYGVDRDESLALDHYNRAIVGAKSVEGWLGVARLTLRHAQHQEQFRQAERIYAEVGDEAERAEPWLALGRIALYGLSGSPDLRRARTYFSRAAEFGEPLGLTGIALIDWREGKYLRSIYLRSKAVIKSLRRDLAGN